MVVLVAAVSGACGRSRRKELKRTTSESGSVYIAAAVEVVAAE
jgi:hypothetical protein